MTVPDTPASKNSIYVEAGRRGAQKRWAGHDSRVVRLDALTPEQRRLVLALIEAAKSRPIQADEAA